jgi:hypothetical protein
MKNIFELSVSNEMISRIEKLTVNTAPQWGKMNVAQMLAHCSVTYEFVFDNTHKKPNAFIVFMLKLLVKGNVVNEKPYKQNGGTAPQFIIKNQRDFEVEKKRLINYISKTQQLGQAHFDGKESYSFGKLTANEWNNMFYKHLNHHLSQFGV